MAARSVIVRLEAEVAGYIAGMGRAGRATENVARQVVQARRSVEDNSAAMDKAGKLLLGFGTVSVAALGASAKAAMDWETAWAGVTKTVDGTPAQMDALEQSLRNMAKTLPATHEEIAGVAEAAGQLGVKRADIAGFTKTMVDLGVSTNLTAEDAATSIAQISNVMGTMAREGSDGVSRFGATLVALGNDGASTEADILSMAQRIAGTGAIVGATEADVLALSNTLSSMGVKAELGGGVATRVLLKMYAAVKDGGPKLEAFAKTAGMTADDFARAYGDSPVKAMGMVAAGLNKMNDEGGNVVATMKDMGIKGTEELQVMLALASSGDLLTNSLELGAKAWKENSALVEEANKRYATTESQVKIAWNNIKDAAIDAGAVILPVIQTIAESVSGLAQAFGDLPEPVQKTLVVLTGVIGAAALVSGGMLTLLPKIVEARAAFRNLNSAGSSVPGTFGKIAKGAGIAAAAIIALQIAGTIFGKEDKKSAEDYAQALLRVASSTKDIDASQLDPLFQGFKTFAGVSNVDGVNGIADAVARISNANGIQKFTKSFDGLAEFLNLPKSELGDLEERMHSLGDEMGNMARSGNTEAAAKGFMALTQEFQKNGKGAREALESVPGYRDALKGLATEAGITLTDQELLNFAMGKAPAAMQGAASGADVLNASIEETGVGLEGVIADMDKFLDQLFAAGLITMSARDATANYNESLRAFPEVMKEINDSGGKMGEMLLKNKSDFDLSTEAGSKANAAFQDIARNGMEEVKAKADEGMGQAGLQESLNKTYQDLINNANAAGIHGKAAEDLARKVLGVPDDINVKTWIEQTAAAQADALKKQLDDLNGKRIAMHIDTYRTTFEKTVGLPAQIADGSYGQGLGVYAPGKAGGGDLDSAPGPKGTDSKLFFGAKGEHVFTADEVDKMGGQDAVYKFRAKVRSGEIQALAGGGTVGGRVGTMISPQGPTRLAIDYDRLKASGDSGNTYQFTVPDHTTAKQFIEEAQYQTRARNRGGKY